MTLESPHRRYNPLSDEWVLVSPHRARRPWLGQVEEAPAEDLPPYDPGCYLCPGNLRAGGARNADYTSTFAFDNDFPALLPPRPADSGGAESTPLFRAEKAAGVCRVLCFSPRHDLTLPELPLAQVEAVVRAWTDQTRELGALDFISYVMVFENKGLMMGCSNPHPHSQVWATGHLPDQPARELAAQSRYLRERGSCLLCDYGALERANPDGPDSRLVTANEHFTAIVPFWAVWPFEILLLANRHAASLADLTASEVTALADILRRVTTRYDNLFQISFPYSMGFHQPPTDGNTYEAWHLHAHFYPPLLRSATIRKFMVGYEMLAMPQRDLTAEAAAERLRAAGDGHYRAR